MVTRFREGMPPCSRNCRQKSCHHPKGHGKSEEIRLSDFETIPRLYTLTRYPLLDLIPMNTALQLARLQKQLSD